MGLHGTKRGKPLGNNKCRLKKTTNSLFLLRTTALVLYYDAATALTNQPSDY